MSKKLQARPKANVSRVHDESRPSLRTQPRERAWIEPAPPLNFLDKISAKEKRLMNEAHAGSIRFAYDSGAKTLSYPGVDIVQVPPKQDPNRFGGRWIRCWSTLNSSVSWPDTTTRTELIWGCRHAASLSVWNNVDFNFINSAYIYVDGDFDVMFTSPWAASMKLEVDCRVDANEIVPNSVLVRINSFPKQSKRFGQSGAQGAWVFSFSAGKHQPFYITWDYADYPETN